MPAVSPEVLVVGGGPAGCAAARLLAQWGHRVVLATKPRDARPLLGESIPPSARKLFEVLGVLPAIESAGFVRSTGNTVWWGRSTTPRVEYFAHGAHGWQTTTEAIETVLHDAAASAGVFITHTPLSADDVHGRDAQFVLDCTGRAGVCARSRGLRSHEDDHRTVALVGLWRSPAFAVPEASHTLIESYDDGWAWSVPYTLDQRFVAVMVDPRTSALAREGDARHVYEHQLRKTRQFAALTEPAQLMARPTGWDASSYFATRYVDDNVLLVGDAGSFIDPLSSAGVKKALASGWLAAVAVHTSLVQPSMRATALDFFDAREAEVYQSFRAMTRRFLAAAAEGHSRPFWNQRAEPDDDTPDYEVTRAAFEQIRVAPALSLGIAGDVRVESRPAVSGREIVLESRLVSVAHPRGMRYAHDVDLIALVQLAPSHTSVPDLFASYNRLHAPVALPDFLAALSMAVGQKWLLWL